MGFIVRCKALGSVPEADLATIRGRPGVTVLDESDRMLLIQTSQETADELARLLPGWSVSPEKRIPLPDTRPRIRNESS